MADNIAKLRSDVALSCRILGREGVSRMAFGHVSARVDQGHLLIKARGPEEEALELVTERDVISVDADGHTLEETTGLTPPNEVAIHTSMYRARPDVGAVIHVHPSWVVALAASGRELVPLYGAYDPSGLRLAREGIPVYQRSVLISTPGLGAEVATTLGHRRVCVLKGHGIVAVGLDVEEATANALALFELARLNWLAYAVGQPAPIEAADGESFDARLQSQRGRARRADGDTPLWHYYKRKLTGDDPAPLRSNS